MLGKHTSMRMLEYQPFAVYADGTKVSVPVRFASLAALRQALPDLRLVYGTAAEIVYAVSELATDRDGVRTTRRTRPLVHMFGNSYRPQSGKGGI